MVGNSNGTPSRVPPGDVSSDALLPSKLFAGRRFVVVGGTGFLGKVWVAMLLHRFPQIAHLHLLVRPKKDQTAEERFWAQIVTSPVFDPLREVHGGGFEAFLRDKITPIPGDVVFLPKNPSGQSWFATWNSPATSCYLTSCWSI